MRNSHNQAHALPSYGPWWTIGSWGQLVLHLDACDLFLSGFTFTPLSAHMLQMLFLCMLSNVSDLVQGPLTLLLGAYCSFPWN